ncbi:MAG TPA: hypothetical protein VK773_03865, partial [Acidimicrobiales bacterium]|nr:hypothetical protein [Acidimicrobiales bacterium]
MPAVVPPEWQFEIAREGCGTVAPSGAPGQGGAGQGAASQHDQFGQTIGCAAGRAGAIPTSTSTSTSTGVHLSGVVVGGLSGKAEPPAGHHVARVDEV